VQGKHVSTVCERRQSVSASWREEKRTDIAVSAGAARVLVPRREATRDGVFAGGRMPKGAQRIAGLVAVLPGHPEARRREHTKWPEARISVGTDEDRPSAVRARMRYDDDQLRHRGSYLSLPVAASMDAG